MKQDHMELLAGAGYGFVEGVVKSVAPASTGFFNTVDKNIPAYSGSAYLSRPVGEAVARGLLTLLLFL